MKHLALLSLSFTICIGLYYLVFFGFAPYWEGDSIAYHIPIARLVLDGNVMTHVPQDKNGIYFYPGNSSVFIAIFLLLGLPLNLFNLLSWILLTITLYFVGRKFGLRKEWAILFSGSVVSLNTVTRLIPTQVADIWVVVFFLWALLLCASKELRDKTYLLLGICLGMIIGMKYSGPLYVIVLVLVYGRKLWEVLTLKRFFLLAVPVLLLGVSWYVRNIFLTGNPMYPANLPFFHGHPHFQDQGFALWRTPFDYHDGLYRIIEAFISEFIFWAIAPLVGIYVFIQQKRKKLSFAKSPQLRFVLILSILLLGVSLLLPIPTINIISNMRYLLLLIIPFMLSMFLMAQSWKRGEALGVLALLNAFFVLAQLHFRPKLFFFYIIVLAFVYFKYDILDTYLAKK